MDLCDLTIHELHDRLARREVRAQELLQAVQERIRRVEGIVHAYVTQTLESAAIQAAAIDARLARGEPLPPLAGIPVALKDIFCTEGVRTTCGSRSLQPYVPPYDATVVARLKAQGVILLGKLNMDEFAMGSSTETSAFGVTRNPWNPEYIPGGSSGGSAAAVAAGECIASVGTDTGGSIRQPAACCGVVGLKPTYGRVSRYGMIAFASSLDQGGPITRDVTDAALVLQAIAGHDPRDFTSIPADVPDYVAALTRDVRGVRIGLPREYFLEGLDPEVARAVREAVRVLEGLGATIAETSLPHTDYALAAYYIIAPAEASSNLARYDGVRYGHRGGPGALRQMYMRTRQEGFGPEVKRRIMLGTYALSAGYYEAYYRKAQQVRTLVRQDFEEAFRRFDVLATPTMPTPPFKLGEKLQDPLQMYLSDVYTIPVNLAGIPGFVLPCGFSSDGLPIGLQLIGRPLDEATLLRVGHAFEQATDYHRRRPPLATVG
ncbi:MAG: Asp-tRNA(Asn)/Glu-tRNA(Gln) amidotransferase subunit GatA [Deltaproteobacteria bacterium]|nr:Asp-tRNA(Asn)/Glu-tRNA(Gln) amidotransferase subunit GatA [Deltaproteobacteria bacterium]